MRPIFLIGALGIAIALILALNYFFPVEEEVVQGELPIETQPQPDPIQPSKPQQTAPPLAVVPETEEPAVELPPLNESDGFLRELLADLALPEEWLALDELIRRTTVVLENTARGVLPRNQLEWLAPEGAYAVQRRGDRYFVDPAGYQRYDAFVGHIDSVSGEKWAQLFNTLQPLFDLALRELGDTQSSSELLSRALREVQRTPELAEPAELIRPKVNYLYADTQLEALSPLQKQLMRMGPENVAALKAIASEVQTHTE